LSEQAKLLMKRVQIVGRDLAEWEMFRLLLVWPAI
jgi:hypothetical protein